MFYHAAATYFTLRRRIARRITATLGKSIRLRRPNYAPGRNYKLLPALAKKCSPNIFYGTKVPPRRALIDLPTVAVLRRTLRRLGVVAAGKKNGYESCVETLKGNAYARTLSPSERKPRGLAKRINMRLRLDSCIPLGMTKGLHFLQYSGDLHWITENWPI